MKTVITYGTFDLFHVGHVRLLERCRNLGDRLIVGCSTDEFNAIKGKRSVVGFRDRVAVLKACRFVDDVFAESHWDQKQNDIRSHKADIFVMGDDWAGKFDYLADLCVVTYLSRTPDISTTDIKSYIGQLNADKVLNLQKTVERLTQQISEL